MERTNQIGAAAQPVSDVARLAEVRQTVLKLMYTTMAEREVWAMETVKHIALVSLAGLAGVFALLQSNKGNAQLAVWAAFAFGMGSVVCVASMYLGAWGRKRYVVRILAPMLQQIAAGSLPTAAEFSPPWVNLMNRFIFGVGLVSALLTLIGAVTLFLALP